MTLYSIVVLLPNFESICCSMSGSDCCFLTYIQASQGQVRWSNIPISLKFSSLLQSIVKSFSIVNETEVDVLLEFPCFLYNPANAGNLIPGSSTFSKPSWYIWKFSVHVLLKPSLKNLMGWPESSFAFSHNILRENWLTQYLIFIMILKEVNDSHQNLNPYLSEY